MMIRFDDQVPAKDEVDQRGQILVTRKTYSRKKIANVIVKLLWVRLGKDIQQLVLGFSFFI